MKTSTEIIDLIYNYLKDSPLKAELSGDIYPLQRPENSGKEDLVIGTLTLGDGSVQIGVFNLNLHVPNIKVKIGEKEQTQPDRRRMRVISGILRDLFSEQFFEDCSAWITNIAEIKEPNLDEWYVNHRLEIRVHETEF